jgi:ComF family protein
MNKVWRNFSASLGQIANQLLPAHCVFCAAVLPAGRICAQCLPLLPWNNTFCVHCGQPLPALEPAAVPCGHCQEAPPPYRKARAPLIYDFPVDSAVKALKFQRQLNLAPALAELLLPTLEQDFQYCDALIPVPLHRWRQMRRGFNQAFELCRPLCKASRLRILTDVVRIRPTQSQSGLHAAARRKNLRNAFTVHEVLQCRRPLIVDDVITTGATVSQLAETLLRAGAEDVSVLAIARVDQFSHWQVVRPVAAD